MKTVVQVFQYLRDICTKKLLESPMMLGGNKRIVEIDESLFRHKPKYRRGRHPKKEQWVFGMVDTSSSPAISYLQLVEKRDAETLLPIIARVVQPGSIVRSDQWRAYSRISELGYIDSQPLTQRLAFTPKPSSLTGANARRG